MLYSEEVLTRFQNKGVIYILINSSFKEAIVKIGKTSRQSEKRAKELSSATGVPTPFKVLLERVVLDIDLAEKLIHKKLDAQRINPRREFFQLPLTDAVRTVFEICADVDEQLLHVSNSTLTIFVRQEFTAEALREMFQSHIGGTVMVSIIFTSKDGKAKCEMTLGDEWKIRNTPRLFYELGRLQGVGDFVLVTTPTCTGNDRENPDSETVWF